MESLQQLMQGFGTAMQPMNLFWVTLGGVLGTIVGMLPGLGPAAGVVILLPLTFTMGPIPALITMAGVYYGAMYGGSRSSILINTPGDGAAIAAMWDGYPMAQQGRAEAALAISAIASFFGGLIATVFMIFLSLPISRFALKFGPAEYFLLFVFALTATAVMEKQRLKGFIMMIVGLMISTIGLDPQSGVQRFTFNLLSLQGGVDFLVVILAIYAFGEVLRSFENIGEGKKQIQKKFGKIWISKEDWKLSRGAIFRSGPLGFIIGVLPGAGGTIASIMAYNTQKSLSKQPEQFGKGAIDGVAAPESANNAASVGAMIPMLTLGVPGSGTTAVMIGALTILGLQPGPMLFTTQSTIVWGLIASMIVGNVILAFINIPLAGVLVRVLAVPPKILYPIVLAFSFLGVYTITSVTSDFYLLLIFGIIGYLLSRAKFPLTPLVLACIVGTGMEQYFRRAYKLHDGDLTIFISSPLCWTFIGLTVFVVVLPFIRNQFRNMRAKKQTAE
ncbi:MAG: tripartite tricarboxylate transporter permease [Neisseriaceae bacterium]|nr:tripartite tricarboxylate transporter permease [Neisseriaceae bacterium]